MQLSNKGTLEMTMMLAYSVATNLSAIEVAVESLWISTEY